MTDHKELILCDPAVVKHLPPAFTQLAGGCLTSRPKFFPGATGIKLPHMLPTVAFIPTESLSLIVGALCILLIGRIAFLFTNDYLFPRNKEINVAYSETINQKIRELPLKQPARIAHVGDGYCSLLGADNVHRPGKIIRFLCRVFRIEEPHTHLDGLYDVIVVQDNIRKKYLWRHLKENGYLIVVGWPDRSGNTEILEVVRVKDYYQKPSLLDGKTILFSLLTLLSVCAGAGSVMQAGGIFGPFIKLSLEEQREKYQKDLLNRYIDSYMDAVRIIIREALGNKVAPYIHNQLMNIGRDAIVEALTSSNGKTGTLDEHVYQTIRLRISEKLKRSA